MGFLLTCLTYAVHCGTLYTYFKAILPTYFCPNE